MIAGYGVFSSLGLCFDEPKKAAGFDVAADFLGKTGIDHLGIGGLEKFTRI
ncbi:MAG: hypothetical protein ACXWT1_07150 [Methylobacter sp.]